MIAASAYLTEPRAQAFAILGLAAYLNASPGHASARRSLETFAANLFEQLQLNLRAGGSWFAPHLAEESARLPQVLLRAGMTLGRADMRSVALGSLEWLMARQISNEGYFQGCTIGSDVELPPSDQRPLEAWAAIDACVLAFQASGDTRWVNRAETIFAWYLGCNDLCVRLASEDGGCFASLQSNKSSPPQDAESTLALHFSALALRRLRSAPPGTGTHPSR